MKEIAGTFYEADVTYGIISRMTIDGHRPGACGVDILYATPEVGKEYEGDDDYIVEAFRFATVVCMDHSTQMEEDTLDDHAVVEIDLSEDGEYAKSVYAIYPTPKTTSEIVSDLLRRCDDCGDLELWQGVHLCTAKELAEEQKDWDDDDPQKAKDFSASAYWVVADDVLQPVTGSDLSDIIAEHFPE